MREDQKLAKQSLGEVIEAIASNRIAPGAGSAAAVGLALAAACAGKAVAITCKHRPHDIALARTREVLSQIAVHALEGADEDALRFAEFMKEQNCSTAHQLLDATDRLRQLGSVLIHSIEQCEASIESNLCGDITAARALCSAFAQIETNNLSENQRAASHLTTSAE
jgi:hypothetical protein